MIAVRCQHCARRFALFCLGVGDPCPFCGAREIVQIEESAGVESAPPQENTVTVHPDGWWYAHVNFGNGWQWIGNPPPVTEPPAIERRVITEHTNKIARDLVLSALGGDEQEKENEP